VRPDRTSAAAPLPFRTFATDDDVKILAIDTSSEHCSCALAIGTEVRQRIELAGQRHSLLLLPMVQSLLDEAGLRLAGLDGVAVAVGPGAFTSLRIGTAVAQGLAFGAGLPVRAVGSLEAIAWGVGRERVLVCTDARMGEVYWAAFERRDGLPLAVVGPAVQPPAALALPSAGWWCGAGNGWRVHADALEGAVGASIAERLPDAVVEARHVATLAMAACPQGFTDAPETLVPVYVRDKVALTVAER
jgi:tRNA threonylcarbamoyladenosine biosynthesis protein TsaB